jgi:hypothetical protein
LIAARALIDTPNKWTKGAWQTGCTYCAAGAARKVIFGTSNDWSLDFWATPIALALDAQAPGHNVALYNDDPATTHNDVLALFDRAIEAAS